MKLDNDKASLQSLAHTPPAKSFKNSNDSAEILNQTKFEFFPETNEHETNDVGFWPVSDFNGSDSPAKLQNGNKTAEATNFVDEFRVFTDKNVTECEVSEVVITPIETQQPSCHEVKEKTDVSQKEVHAKLEEDKSIKADDHPKTNYVSNLVPFSDHDFYGETSFSMVGGLISYSGSLSLRSESSTTSTRSFAFPVMQSEWNSSPVKMAKVERSQLRKSKGWRQGILCCRF